MRLRDGLAVMHGPAPRRGSAWRWFPLALIAVMSVVFAVNGIMVWCALGTFPGQAGSDGFDLSNHYDRVLETVQREAALGWQIRATTDAAGRPELRLTDRAGMPLRGAQVVATAERPLGPRETTPLVFRDDGTGRYVADAVLAAQGQWELQLTASANGQTLVSTRRVVAPKPVPPGVGQAGKRGDAAGGAG